MAYWRPVSIGKDDLVLWCSVGLFCAVVICLACGCQDPVWLEKPMPQRKTPIPEKEPGDPLLQKTYDPIDPLEAIAKSAYKVPPAIRHSTPGAVRWMVALDAPIRQIRRTPLGGLIVSSGREVHNVTGRGDSRWHFVAGENHRLFSQNEQEIVWMPQFGNVAQLLRRGRTVWTRDWLGEVVEDEKGSVYLVDASNVSALGPDGTDRWRVSLGEYRDLEGPFSCDDGLLFAGSRGLAGVAVHLTYQGTVVWKRPLPKGTAVIGAGRHCEPLVWQQGELSLWEGKGRRMWRRDAPSIPVVERVGDGFVLLHASPGIPARLVGLSFAGDELWNVELPVAGTINNASFVRHDTNRVIAIGLCVDVSSPCARPDGDRGPFNMLLTASPEGDFRVLVRYVRGHLSYAPYAGGALLTASSLEDNSTELVLRDAHFSTQWQVQLPGRLTAGPYVGGSGTIYVGTCRGWNCAPPHNLIAVTGERSAEADGSK